ncbi:hypothetical protein GON03_08640 [Nocardioides sp. MAH-18]|uniref:Uncharacterized protein n=1 Tax=Nocardioides agri TaxID=2682843 RepID=A0A6L6XQK2_9ACTN|nr:MULTISPECIES: hypothetical protein [unclassified Nocardioides]MBA2954387.1 hypothetical protein [Nocardioides sp. CGMCC 1.13656]MVQ49248.1 hypothetical protein [Nocardioides sp. MAH-18]
MGEIEKTDGEWERGQRTDDLAGPLLTGFAIGALLVGLVWWAVAMVTSDSDGAGSGQAGEAEIGAPLAAPGATPAAAPSRMDRCAAAARGLTGPLQLAQPAMDQWAVHVGAMNKLVVGEITLTQATAFWNQTRVGAHQRIQTFDRATARIERDGVDCPAPRLLGTGVPAAVRACSTQVEAEVHALDAARTAIATWRHHVADMEQLRLGKLSPTAATQMWLSMWQRGVSELDDYRAAAKAAQRGPGCDGEAGDAPAAAPSETPEPTHSMSSMH